MPKTLLTAHSGCDGTQDNSMAYVDYALSLDVNCIEVDIRMDKHGVLILSHDEGPGHAQLDQAFSALKGHPEKRINCDFKQADLEQDVWALAQKMDVERQLVFSGTVSEAIAKTEPDIFHYVQWFVNIELLFPQIKTMGLADAVNALGYMCMADKLQKYISDTGACCINTHHSIARTPLYQELLNRKVNISVWTPDDEDAVKDFVHDGVYNITTRNARRISKMVQELFN